MILPVGGFRLRGIELRRCVIRCTLGDCGCEGFIPCDKKEVAKPIPILERCEEGEGGTPGVFCEVVGRKELILARAKKAEKKRRGCEENKGVSAKDFLKSCEKCEVEENAVVR